MEQKMTRKLSDILKRDNYPEKQIKRQYEHSNKKPPSNKEEQYFTYLKIKSNNRLLKAANKHWGSNKNIKDIPISSLIRTQDYLNHDKVKEKENDNTPITVFHYQGKHYIVDGHHRAARDEFLNKETTSANVFDVDDWLQKNPKQNVDKISW